MVSENDVYPIKNSIPSNYIRKQIKDLLPGDIVLHPIYRSDGLMLINKYKKLSSSLIKIIHRHITPDLPVLVASSESDYEIFLQGTGSSNAEFIENLSNLAEEYNSVASIAISTDSLMQERSTVVETNEMEQKTNMPSENNYFIKLFSSSPLWMTFDNRLESDVSKTRAASIKNDLLNTLSSDNIFLKLLNKIKEYNDVLLIHSINTTCISLMIGLVLELNNGDLIDLAIASLFSNVGFTEVPKDSFKDYLRDINSHTHLLKKHLELFTELTSESIMLRKKSIIYGILDHHEYYNGKGYPNRKKGNQISLFGRILSIAQSYDEMVGGYLDGRVLLPREALKVIYENKDMKFDPKILNIFIYRTTYYKIGETIFLSNNQKGEIIGFTDFLESPHLPIVRLENGKIIDLSKNTSFY
ncbi:HD-GYP domain-containing protein [Petroclostridium xylanilyticum]|uniref:HD-GYP domain-containing protein n=1 Tax=Petroclostridium xylanilyticum TaxID=1792311 RepID=UPI000B97D2D5|nr:HD domain-containing phosphohydrolase [Petroclostridium xylanilyticum]